MNLKSNKLEKREFLIKSKISSCHLLNNLKYYFSIVNCEKRKSKNRYSTTE